MTVADASPRNPLRTYTFRVRFADSDTPVAGVRKVSGLSMSVQAHEIWEGGNSLHRYAQPDRATWEPITLEQGLALDDSLETWAQACLTYLETGEPPPGVPVKRNVIIQVWDPHRASGDARTPPDGAAAARAQAGDPSAPRRREYEVVNAWVSRFQALPALDAMTHDVGLLLLELTHEGWRPHPPTEQPAGPSTRSP